MPAETEATAEAEVKPTFAARLRTWWPVVTVVGVLLAAGIVAIPLGGWDTVVLQSRIVPAHPVGETYVGNRLSTSIDEVYLTDVNPDGYTEPEPGETYLVVVATMENMRPEPEFPLGSGDFYAFTVPRVLALGADISIGDYEVYLERDLTYLPQLNPGVPDTVLFFFVVADDLYADGDEIVIGITDANPEAADIYLGTRWMNPRVVADVTLTIEDER